MGEKKVILVVDDEVSITRMLKEKLESQGYSVVMANDGLSGFNFAHSENPDLILLDLMLPKMDGHKVCALLKGDDRFSNVPIVFLTARAEKEDEELAEEVGADLFITKPINFSELNDKIKELIT